jgi:arginine decarboxylase
MHLSATDPFTVERALELYGIDRWGNGYLTVGPGGHLEVCPQPGVETRIDVYETVRRLAERGTGTPLLLRFPQLLTAQVDRLAGAFASAIEEFDYRGGYRPLFPIKVNQTAGVVEQLVRGGERHGLGLEVGSRAELLTAVALPAAADALILCNGFKDQAYLSAAMLGTRLGKRVVVVIEKPFELDHYIALAARGESALPELGFRIRLHARGSGLWEKSGGYASKFGLSTHQLLQALALLREAGLADRIALLHFHIGSQVTEIRKVKSAVLEAARIYAKVHKLGTPIRFVDVGGGLGVDYDGSKTSSDASVNYTVQEYANDVVFGIKDVCEQERVPTPSILSESGRMLVAYHSLLVTDVRGVIGEADGDAIELRGGEAQVVQDLAEVERNLTVKNYREFYHDAIAYREQLHSGFNLGMIGLEERALGERLFWRIARTTVRHSKSAKFVADEFVELETRLREKYICNFSVFQSLPDHWALDQLFPIVPVHRLNERPTRRATLADITCDSDGEVEKFVDLRDIKDALELHTPVPGEPYYVAVALIGAYQDTMGDLHNLFGRVHEVQVSADASGETRIDEVWPGETAAETIATFGYDTSELTARVERRLAERVAAGELGAGRAAALLDRYCESLERYTYLD